MQHLGDITQISGYTVPIVDCVIGGSPCQGLSVAGLGKGLDDERSGLFIEQVRITKEMRDRDRENGRTGVDIRPRYMVWENVPGAFSSNSGEDFRVVLEELARIGEPEVTIPRPPKGKWQTSGVIIGDGYSIAWRIMDAQYYGVPQRRRRIVLVADFGGHSAPRVVFGDGQHLRGSVGADPEQAVRHSGYGRGREISSVGDRLRGDTPSGGETRQGVAPDAQRGVGADDPAGAGGAVAVGVDGYNAACTGDKSATLGVNCGLSSGRNGVLCYDARGNGDGRTVNTITGDHENRITDYTSVVVEPTVALEGNGQRPSHHGDGYIVSDKSYTLNTTEVHGVVYALDRASFNQGENAQYDFEITDSGVNSTLVAKGPSAVAYGIDHVITTGGNCTAQGPCVYEDVQATLKAAGPHAVCYGIGNGQANQSYSEEQVGALNCMHDQQAVAAPAKAYYIVRRLTPTECERLQGYPDGWTDIGDWVDSKGKKHKAADSPRYKALGNSIALPVWKIILKRLCACYERDATMASLFDGIGGFPYLWEQINGEGSCLWASEIEEFPMAVTRKRINKEQ